MTNCVVQKIIENAGRHHEDIIPLGTKAVD